MDKEKEMTEEVEKGKKTAEKIASLQQEINDLKEKHWDKSRGCWNVQTIEEVKELQKRYRTISHEIQALIEEDLVSTAGFPLEQKQKLMPLILRRQQPHVAEAFIGKYRHHVPDSKEPEHLWKDGDQFCFDAEQVHQVRDQFCNCGAWPIDAVSSPETLKAAEEHLKHCQNIREEITETVIARIKHSRGDWKCKGCLNSEITHGELEPRKWIEWCPNFPEWAREGEQRNEDLKCYGGLLHSQIQIEARVQEGDKIIQQVKIVQVCDTCDFRHEEVKSSEWKDTGVEIKVN